MAKEGTWQNKNVDLKKLAKLIENFFYSENFSEVGLLEDPNGSWYEVQAKKTGVFRTLTSTRKSLHTVIKGSPVSFAVHVGVGEWGSNITAAVLLNPSVSLMGMGLNRRFTGKLWNFIKDSVDSLENSYKQSITSTETKSETPLEILQKRLALGEITKEEFVELAPVLENNNISNDADEPEEPTNKNSAQWV